jgi:hypothetical protein
LADQIKAAVKAVQPDEADEDDVAPELRNTPAQVAPAPKKNVTSDKKVTVPAKKAAPSTTQKKTTTTVKEPATTKKPVTTAKKPATAGKVPAATAGKKTAAPTTKKPAAATAKKPDAANQTKTKNTKAQIKNNANAKKLLTGIPVNESKGDLNVRIRQVQFDSRKVAPGDLFVAVKGTHTDGHQFIAKAIEQGAVAVVCEEMPSELPDGVVFVRIENTQKNFGIIASAFYGNPSDNLKVVGVTGTNGKTTIATLLYKTFSLLGYKVGLISTIKYYVGDDEFPATHTTPDALAIQQLMAKMVEAGCEYCFMEVSSHAVDQDRISGSSLMEPSLPI